MHDLARAITNSCKIQMHDILINKMITSLSDGIKDNIIALTKNGS